MLCWAMMAPYFILMYHRAYILRLSIAKQENCLITLILLRSAARPADGAYSPLAWRAFCDLIGVLHSSHEEEEVVADEFAFLRRAGQMDVYAVIITIPFVRA